jgi:putative transposase
MGRSRYQFGEAAFPHFVTCTVVGWLPVFTRPQTVQIMLDSWQFLQDQDRIVLLGNVVLENHVHFIASAKDLAKGVGDFKPYTARRIIDHVSERRVRTLLNGLEYHKVRQKTDRPFQPSPIRSRTKFRSNPLAQPILPREPPGRLLFQNPAREVLWPHGQEAAPVRRRIRPTWPELRDGKLLFVEPPEFRNLERRVDSVTVDL